MGKRNNRKSKKATKSKKIIYPEITELDLSYKKLNNEKFYAEIAKYPNLKKLNCSGNQITNVDHLPRGLQILNCSYNQITNIDHLPPSLQELNCHSNKITKIDHLPHTLQILICNINLITNVDYLPADLQILDCDNNRITNVDHLPPSLKELNCCINKITNVDHLPPTLQSLMCSRNKITNVDHLYSNLLILDCNYTKINNLDYLQTNSPSLLLWCYYNDLIVRLYCVDLYVKRAKYLRFLRNLINTRKTYLLLSLRRIQQESCYGAQCLPNEIIKHIISFV